jgi:hypothetical protein
MPRPTPPPPPQPSVDETVLAVAYLRRVVAVGLGFFLAWTALAYGPDSAIGRYGRTSAQSWMRHAVQRLDEPLARSHAGGRIVWLVGSSILREGFDAEAINAELSVRESPYRVLKFGQDRGAGLLAAGLVRRLPVREGDVVVHNVSVQNFRSDWLAWTGIPTDRLSRILSPLELWQLSSIPVQDRLEQAAAWPPRFWAWHEETQEGLTRWWLGLASFTAPRRFRAGYHLRFHTYERGRAFRKGLPPRELATNGLEDGIIRFDPDQVNVVGIDRMRQLVSDRGAELRLLDVPPSDFAQWRLQGPQTRADWDRWRAEQPELVYGPQLDGADYYDRRHPNFRGRAVLSAWLVEWLDGGMPAGHPVRPPESSVREWPWPERPPPPE